jgi:lipoprotein-anchoring transpeptidase ErfK/SrfK
VDNGLPVTEVSNEMSVEEVEKYELRMDTEDAKKEGLAPEEFARIRNMNPANNDGKVVIRVHESTNPAVPEYLEVNRQNSANPDDVTPLNLFDNGASNKALVSTSKAIWVIKGVAKHFSTPPGNFSFDRFELMHHSAAFENAPMPHSMFFNSGIAIHAATGSELKDLGKVASHGCVRTHPTTATILYNYLESQPGGPKNAVVEVLAPENQ